MSIWMILITGNVSLISQVLQVPQIPLLSKCSQVSHDRTPTPPDLKLHVSELECFGSIFTLLNCCQKADKSTETSCKRSTEQFYTVGRQTLAGWSLAGSSSPTTQSFAGSSSPTAHSCLVTTEPSSTQRRLMGWAYYARTIPTSFDGCLLHSTILCCFWSKSVIFCGLDECADKF